MHLKRLMAQHPTPQTSASASYPHFHPHITLSLPSDAAYPLTLRETIPLAQRAVPVRFVSRESGSHYFRSVFLAVQPSDALDTLHTHIHAALGVPPAFPHMSLYYIADADAAEDVEFLFLSIKRQLRDRYSIRREAIAKYALAREALDF